LIVSEKFRSGPIASRARIGIVSKFYSVRKAMKQTSKIVSFFAFPAAVLLIHLVASNILDLYTIFPHLDMPIHYMGGLSIAYTTTQILTYLGKGGMMPPLNKYVLLILVLALTATAAVFWEFLEFIIDQLLAANIQIGLANTMQDQFMGILGGATWVLLFSKKTMPNMA
jgi:hypothetical protein